MYKEYSVVPYTSDIKMVILIWGRKKFVQIMLRKADQREGEVRGIN